MGAWACVDALDACRTQEGAGRGLLVGQGNVVRWQPVAVLRVCVRAFVRVCIWARGMDVVYPVGVCVVSGQACLETIADM